jgi:hypothetical protein
MKFKEYFLMENESITSSEKMDLKKIKNLKLSDFPLDSEGRFSISHSKVEIEMGKYRVDIYKYKEGFFAIIRNFVGEGQDFELNEYPTLGMVKKRLLDIFTQNTPSV